MSKRNAIVLAADRSMLPPAAFLAHHLDALKNRDDTDIIVFSDWDRGLQHARRLVPGADFRHVDFRDSLGTVFKPSRRFPEAAYFRVNLPRLLGDNYAKVLYLDTDIYAVSDSVFDLFSLDLGDAPLAAVRSLTQVYQKSSKALQRNQERFFNSGVLLIDCANYLDQQIDTRVWDTIRDTNGVRRLGDQGILNRVLKDLWLEISPRYNLNFKLAFSEIAQLAPPVILHFIGRYKAWDTPTRAQHHPARREMEAFLAGTVWRHYIARRRWSWNAAAHPLLKIRNAFGLSADELQEIVPLQQQGLDLPRLLAFLENTEFADVCQQLTSINPESIEAIRRLSR